jgi:hypothetical protein
MFNKKLILICFFSSRHLQSRGPGGERIGRPGLVGHGDGGGGGGGGAGGLARNKKPRRMDPGGRHAASAMLDQFPFES